MSPESEEVRQEKARHPMGVVTRRTGLTADTLRAWERRYGAVDPERSEGGHRYYSDEEVHRLRLLSEATDAGHKISQIAELDDAELEELVAAERAAARRRTASASGVDPESFLRGCLEAVLRMDERALVRELDRASVELGRTMVVERVLVPLLHEIGDLWSEGELRSAHEHLASAVVRSFLADVGGAYHVPASAPEIVVTTPAGQLHEFGALLAVGTAAAAGWRAVYLGPSLPAEDVAAAIAARDARAAALSVTFPVDEDGVVDEIGRLVGLLDDDVHLFVGGRCVDAYAEELETIGAVVIVELDELRSRLSGLSRGGERG